MSSDGPRRSRRILEEWLDEAAVAHAANEQAEGDERAIGSQAPPPTPDRVEVGTGSPAQAPRTPIAEELLEAAVSRIERSFLRNAGEALRALESLKRLRAPSGVDVAAPSEEPRQHNTLPAPRPRQPTPPASRIDPQSAGGEIAGRRLEDIGTAGGLTPQEGSDQGRAWSASPRSNEAAHPREDARSPMRGGSRSPERVLRSSLKAPQGGIRAFARKLDHLVRVNAELTSGAAGIATVRAEIAEIRRALADVAPRNAIVALEGAIRDLTRRVEILRQNGHWEALLGPLDAMAAELRATLKAHDPQTAAHSLERDIRAIGAKIESLAQSAVKPETVEGIRAQTEEVRNLLAAAAARAAPAERLERRIAELADRIERLAVSAAPQAEIRQLAAALADLGKEIEVRTPLPALASIERRLERIAQRLDQELARPVQAAFDPRPLEDLARRIDGAEQLIASVRALNARLEGQAAEPLADLMREISAKLDAAQQREAAPLLDRRLSDIVDKLDRTPQALPAPAADMRPLVEALRALEAKIGAPPAPPLDREALERVADAVARRFGDAAANWATADVQALVQQLAEIHDKLDVIAGASQRSGTLEPLVSALLARLRETKPAAGDLGRMAEQASLAVELSGLRLEQAQADQHTQARLKGLEQGLGRLVERLGVLSPFFRSAEPQPREDAATRTPAREGGSAQTAPAAETRPPDARPDAPAAPDEEEFLLEPGQGVPKRVRDAREAVAAPARPASTLSAHIAAARRAAQAPEPVAMEETASPSAASPPPRRLIFTGQRGRYFLAAALVALIAGAVRFGAPALVALHKPADDAGAARSAANAPATAPSGGAFDPLGARMDARAIDVTPTATIDPNSPPAKVRATAASAVPGPPPAVPAGAPQALRDAATAGVPGAEYELASRLYDGRGGLAQDQRAAALWFQRAAEAGFAPAEFRIAALYQKGVGVAHDEGAARRWYTKAAEAGNARAAHNLAVMDAEPADGEPDYAEAAKWFRKAAGRGLRDSQFNLAVLCARGLGVERDLKEAWMWFSLAAAQGDAEAGKKRDEVAARMDAGSLAAAAEALSKFKAEKPDPAANEVESPPGGWDAAPGPASPASTPPSGQTGLMTAPARPVP